METPSTSATTSTSTCENCQCIGGTCEFNVTLRRCLCHCQEFVFGDVCSLGMNDTKAHVDTGALPTRKSNFTLEISVTFQPAFNNLSSPQSLEFIKTLEKQLEALCREADPQSFKEVQVIKLSEGSVVAESVAVYNYLNNETQIDFVNNQLEGVLTNILNDTKNLKNISKAFNNSAVELNGVTFQSPNVTNITDLEPFINCSRFANYTTEIVNGQWQCAGPCKTNPDYCQHGQCFNDINKGPICINETTPMSTSTTTFPLTSQETSTRTMSSSTETPSTSATTNWHQHDSAAINKPGNNYNNVVFINGDTIYICFNCDTKSNIYINSLNVITHHQHQHDSAAINKLGNDYNNVVFNNGDAIYICYNTNKHSEYWTITNVKGFDIGGTCEFNVTLGRCLCHCQEFVFGDVCSLGMNDTTAHVDTGALPTRKSNFTLEISVTFQPAFNNLSSPQSLEFIKTLEKQLEALCREADPQSFKEVQVIKLSEGSVVAESVAVYNYLNNETQIDFVNNQLEGVLTNILNDTKNLKNISKAFNNSAVELNGVTFQSPNVTNITDLEPFINCSRFANYTTEIVNGQWQCAGPCKTNPDYCQHGQCFNDINKGPICINETTPMSTSTTTFPLTSQETSTRTMHQYHSGAINKPGNICNYVVFNNGNTIYICYNCDTLGNKCINSLNVITHHQ
ncbi:uncharacterized protein LOC131968124 [Centropristis striata]|uniref:uncharacterized protein LOC131968124 n=1 Tax=Centropristis striata TaxID=184440 RepID=UPI0027E061FC|nr:uncharacterized protein LOC131968124 [Centropristis striata]